MNKITGEGKDSDGPEADSSEILELFADAIPLTVEKLPMIYAILLNEKSKEENMTLDDYLIIVNIGIMNKRNRKAKLAENDGVEHKSDKLANLVSFRRFPSNMIE